MMDAVMYGMMPRANTVRRRILPPANISKKPKIEPCCEEKNSAHFWRLIPGVGIWLPRRYTASSPRVNRSRLRRSGTRKMFANASKNFMVPFDPALLAWSANHLRLAAGLLDLLQRRFGKLMRLQDRKSVV